MKFWLPKNKEGKYNTLAVSIDGKPYDVQQDKGSNGRAMVDTGSTDVTPRTLGHLITLGWLFADVRTAKVAQEEAGVVLGPDGQAKTDETLKKNS